MYHDHDEEMSSEEDHEMSMPMTVDSAKAKKGRRRKKSKKAPGAPTRGRSAYILFSMDKRDEVKATLPPDHKVTDVMKATGEMWRVADEATKAVYKQLADDDKARYAAELEHYDGPLKVQVNQPNKRAKKDPNAPKGKLTAFFCFTRDKRPFYKDQFPDAKHTELSKHLGAAWGRMTDAEKLPYQREAEEDAERYRLEMEVYNANLLHGGHHGHLQHDDEEEEESDEED